MQNNLKSEITTKHLIDVSVSIAAARRSGRPVTFLGALRPDGLEAVAKARAEGLKLIPQTSCRPTLTDFRLVGMGIFDQLPSWRRVMRRRHRPSCRRCSAIPRSAPPSSRT